MIDAIKAMLGDNMLSAQHAGSRVTCNPPPMNTDDDYILHVKDMNQAGADLIANGYEFGGSEIPADVNYTNPDEWFASFTKDEINLIVTGSETFYSRFVVATSIAKRLNLMNKNDRIALFQGVLYGRQWIEQEALA